MKKTCFAEARIMGVLRQMENGVPVVELRQEHRMSSVAVYRWRAKYGGLDANITNKVKTVAEENCRSKRMQAHVNTQNDLLNATYGWPRQWHRFVPWWVYEART